MVISSIAPVGCAVDSAFIRRAAKRIVVMLSELSPRVVWAYECCDRHISLFPVFACIAGRVFAESSPLFVAHFGRRPCCDASSWYLVLLRLWQLWRMCLRRRMLLAVSGLTLFVLSWFLSS